MEGMDWAIQQVRKLSSSPVEGVSIDEVLDYQRAQELILPEAYIKFLVNLGREPGDFLDGSNLRLSQLTKLQRSAGVILEECDGPTLPERAFVFAEHQGYQFLFFVLGLGDDPPVMHYLEEDAEFRQVAPSFSSWFIQTVREDFSDND